MAKGHGSPKIVARQRENGEGVSSNMMGMMPLVVVMAAETCFWIVIVVHGKGYSDRRWQSDGSSGVNGGITDGSNSDDSGLGRAGYLLRWWLYSVYPDGEFGHGGRVGSIMT